MAFLGMPFPVMVFVLPAMLLGSLVPRTGSAEVVGGIVLCAGVVAGLLVGGYWCGLRAGRLGWIVAGLGWILWAAIGAAARGHTPRVVGGLIREPVAGVLLFALPAVAAVFGARQRRGV